MSLHQCSFCEASFRSNEDRVSHEKRCSKNYTLTADEKFKNRLELNKNKSQTK